MLRVKLWPGIVTVGALKRPFCLPVRPQTQPLELTVNQTLLCPLLEEYTPSPQPMCRGKAFCFTCQELASNGSFPVCIKWASPPMVSVLYSLVRKLQLFYHIWKRGHIFCSSDINPQSAYHYENLPSLTSTASCTDRRTKPQLYLYLTLLWKQALNVFAYQHNMSFQLFNIFNRVFFLF